jgi:hypothetical protein
MRTSSKMEKNEDLKMERKTYSDLHWKPWNKWPLYTKFSLDFVFSTRGQGSGLSVKGQMGASPDSLC